MKTTPRIQYFPKFEVTNTISRMNQHKLVRARAPWAQIVAKTTNGYFAFESLEDYRTWRDR